MRLTDRSSTSAIAGEEEDEHAGEGALDPASSPRSSARTGPGRRPSSGSRSGCCVRPRAIATVFGVLSALLGLLASYDGDVAPGAAIVVVAIAA